VVDVAIADAEHRDVAFAVEGDVARVFRILGVLRVGPDPVEHAVEIGRQVTFNLAVMEIDFGTIYPTPRAAAAAKGPWLIGKINGTAALRLRGCSRRREAGESHAGTQRRCTEEIPSAETLARLPTRMLRTRPLAHDSPLPCNVRPPTMVQRRARNNKGNDNRRAGPPFLAPRWGPARLEAAHDFASSRLGSVQVNPDFSLGCVGTNPVEMVAGRFGEAEHIREIAVVNCAERIEDALLVQPCTH